MITNIAKHRYHPLSKDNMIIIKLTKKIKYISQNQYNKIIRSLDFDSLDCPKCHYHGLIIHAYYERHIDIFNRKHTIRILRLICPSCKSTHAVLIQDMIPYSTASFDLIVDILSNNDSTYSSHLYFFKLKYLSSSFDYVLFCKLNFRNTFSAFFTFTT